MPDRVIIIAVVSLIVQLLSPLHVFSQGTAGGPVDLPPDDIGTWAVQLAVQEYPQTRGTPTVLMARRVSACDLHAVGMDIFHCGSVPHQPTTVPTPFPAGALFGSPYDHLPVRAPTAPLTLVILQGDFIGESGAPRFQYMAYGFEGILPVFRAPDFGTDRVCSVLDVLGSSPPTTPAPCAPSSTAVRQPLVRVLTDVGTFET